MSQLDIVDEFLREQPVSLSEAQYLPYVNSYPEALRSTVSRYTLDDWSHMAKFITACPQHKSDRHTNSLDLHAWFGAVFLEMTADGGYENVAQTFVFRQMFTSLLGEYEPTQAAIAFETAIQKSGHTCWNSYKSAAGRYASGMDFLRKNLEVEGIGGWEDLDEKECKRCALGLTFGKLKRNLLHFNSDSLRNGLRVLSKKLVCKLF